MEALKVAQKSYAKVDFFTAAHLELREFKTTTTGRGSQVIYVVQQGETMEVLANLDTVTSNDRDSIATLVTTN